MQLNGRIHKEDGNAMFHIFQQVNKSSTKSNTKLGSLNLSSLSLLAKKMYHSRHLNENFHGSSSWVVPADIQSEEHALPRLLKAEMELKINSLLTKPVY